jgi:non-specific serine/threonine protein kinase
MRAVSGYVDPLGLVLAVATGFAIVALQDGAVVAAAAALSVLAVRVGAGILAVRRFRPSDPATDLLPAKWYAPLTAREAEVALLVAEGLKTKEIAARLDRIDRTIETHIENALDKLSRHTGKSFQNRAHLAAWITARRARAARPGAPEPPGRKSVPN